MFAPDKIDLNILENLVMGYLNNSDAISKNQTGYEIVAGEKGVKHGSWINHRDKLLFFQMISKTYEKKPKPTRPTQKTREKIRNKEYTSGYKELYNITPIGFCYLFYNLNLTKSEHLANQNFLKFVPLISNHWKDIHAKFGKIAFKILKDSIGQIQISSVFPIQPRKGDEFGDLFLKQIEEITKINFHGDQISLTFMRNYHTHSKIEKMLLEERNINLYFPNYDELEIDYEKRVTFIFYFNLIMLTTDEIYATKINYSESSKNSKPKDSKNSKLKRPLIPKKSDFENDMKIFEEIYEKQVSFENLMQKNSEFVYELIRDDDELKHVININLKDIEQKLTSFQIFDDIKNKI